MADYLVGAAVIIALVLAVRSYFGKKYAKSASRCSGCPLAKNCRKDKKD